MRLLSKRKTALLAALPLLAVVAACGSSSSASAPSSSASSSSGGTASASSGTGASSSSGTKSTIVLGNVGNYTGAGSFGPQYLQSEHSLEAWASFTNAHGGLNGHPVKIISKDDANSPSNSLSAVKQLIQGNHVTALVDMMTPGTDTAWASYANSEHVPVIGGISLDANWSTNPDLFDTNVDLTAFLSAQIDASKSYGTKLGVLTCAELAECRSGVPFFSKLAAATKIDFASVQLIDASAVSYTAPCLKLKSQGANVVVPELDGTTTRRVIDSCADQGFSPKVVLAASDIDAAALKDSHLEGAVGVTVSPLWFGTSTFTQDWETTYKSLYPNDVLNGYSTLGWQAGVVLAAALKNAPGNVTSQTVLDGLYAQPAKSTYGGWTPPLTYTKGKPATTSPCLWFVQIKNGALAAPKGPNVVCAS